MSRRQPWMQLDAASLSDGVVQIFPPKTLRARVGPGTGLNPRLLANAEATVNALQTAYEQRIANDIAALSARFDAMRRTGRFDHQQIYLIAHEIKGEGGSYDYPLLSAFGHALCLLVRSRDRLTAEDVDTIEAHIAAMRAVIKGQVRGEGGVVGRELAANLEAMVARALDEAPPPRLRKRT